VDLAQGQAVLARRMGDVADRVRAVQQQLGGADAVGWTGLGAARFRAGLARATREVGVVADGCEEAVAALRAHARAVERAEVALRAASAAGVR
jgi:uncharacterized protein YukE